VFGAQCVGVKVTLGSATVALKWLAFSLHHPRGDDKGRFSF
jgi:hypothetical protein